jgi:uncharacterized protein YjbI with pentapeptide repeats
VSQLLKEGLGMAVKTYPYKIFKRFAGEARMTVQIELGPERVDFDRKSAAIKQAFKNGANLSWSDLSWSNLSGLNLSGLDLSGSNFSGSNLSRSNLSRSVLSGSDLSWSDLSRSVLWGSVLWGSNLAKSNLSGSNLSRSDLSGSDLSGSNLSGSDLSGSDLSGSDLSGSVLSGANLSGSVLSGANLSGSKYGEQTIRRIIQGPVRSDGHQPIAFAFEDGSNIIRVGCLTTTLAEYRTRALAYANPAKTAETLAILDYLDAAMMLEAWV